MVHTCDPSYSRLGRRTVKFEASLDTKHRGLTQKSKGAGCSSVTVRKESTPREEGGGALTTALQGPSCPVCQRSRTALYSRAESPHPRTMAPCLLPSSLSLASPSYEKLHCTNSTKGKAEPCSGLSGGARVLGRHRQITAALFSTL